MVQIENEYGSYPKGRDIKYMEHLRDLVHSELDKDVVIYTTDGAGDGLVQNGKVSGVFPTVDFGHGSNVDDAHGVMIKHSTHGPFVNSEYYSGWLDHWTENHQWRSAEEIVGNVFNRAMELGASVAM